MKKMIVRVTIGILFVFALLLLLLSLCLNYFSGRGVNILGNYAHIDVQKTCYFVSADGAQVTGQSTLTIVGMVLPEKKGKTQPFSGYVSVEQYPMCVEDNYAAHSGQITDKFIVISSQSLALLDPEVETYYNVWILKSNPEIIAVQVFNNDKCVTAVCADSEDEVISNFQQYLATITNAK